jgi:hypothetical protein
MKKAEQYLEDIKEKYHIGTAWQVTKPYLLEVIKTAQIDAIEETCRVCAEEGIVEVVDHEELSIETLPANNGKTVILPVYGVDEQSILKIADKMKEELE